MNDSGSGSGGVPADGEERAGRTADRGTATSGAKALLTGVLLAGVLLAGVMVSGLALALWFEGDLSEDVDPAGPRQRLLSVALFAAPVLAGAAFVGALLARRTARWAVGGLLALGLLALATAGIALLC